MNLNHKKYQSLSEVEAHAAVRDIEKLVTDAADAGYLAGFEAAINKIVGVSTGSCSVIFNCAEGIVSECQDYKGGGEA